MTPVEVARRGAAVMRHLVKNVDRAPQVVGELARWAGAGFPVRTPAELAAWKAMCSGPPRCPHYLPLPGTDLMHCAACKCLGAKARLATTACPIGRTPASPLQPG